MPEATHTTSASPGGYTVLARRYRSTGFDELVGQEPIAQALKNAIAHDRTAHAYLFTGTRGVGKTSMARVFAKALNCTDELIEREAIATAILRGEDIDVVEIDGASNRGIDNARDLIAAAGILPARSPFKIYIIDEVHMLTREAFNALLKLMEEPPAHVKFILCTTEPHKVPPTIQSRCQRFDFRNIATARIAEHLRAVVDQESITANDDVLMQVARLANGSMRDGLSLLDRLIGASDDTLTPALLEQVLGLPDRALVEQLVGGIAAGDAGAALRLGDELLQRGHGIEQALDALAEQLRAMMVCVACGPEPDLVDRAGEALDAVRDAAAAFDAPGLVHMIALCEAVARHARQSSVPRALFDALLVRLALAEHFAAIPAAADGAVEKKNRSAGERDAGAVTAARSAPRPAPSPSPSASPSPTAAVIETKPPVETTPPASSTPAEAASSSGAAPTSPTLAASPPPASREAPASPESEAVDESDVTALWARVVEATAVRQRDRALISELRPGRLAGDRLTLQVTAAEPALAEFLRSSVETVSEIVQRVTGRRFRVTIEGGGTETIAESTPMAGQDTDALAAEPVVRQAMEIFDATIIGVTDRVAPGSSTSAADHVGDGPEQET